MRAERTPAISAHRGGTEAAAGTYEAYDFALAAGAAYLELDARQTSDGTLVASHRARLAWGRPVAGLAYRQLCQLAGYEVPRITQVLPLLAGRAGLHLDVKDAGAAARAAELALGALGPAGVVVTTRDAALARALVHRFPALQVGLAIGGDLAESARFLARRWSGRAGPGWTRSPRPAPRGRHCITGRPKRAWPRSAASAVSGRWSGPSTPTAR